MGMYKQQYIKVSLIVGCVLESQQRFCFSVLVFWLLAFTVGARVKLHRKKWHQGVFPLYGYPYFAWFHVLFWWGHLPTICRCPLLVFHVKQAQANIKHMSSHTGFEKMASGHVPAVQVALFLFDFIVYCMRHVCTWYGCPLFCVWH